MTPTEALKILGLWPTPEQVKARFAELVKEAHPDVALAPYSGGLLINKYQEARDALLPKINSAPTNPCIVCKGSGRVAMRECSSCRGTGERQ